MRCLHLNSIQTLHLYHTITKYSLYGMKITYFLLEKFTLTAWILKIMSVMSINSIILAPQPDDIDSFRIGMTLVQKIFI